MAAEVLKETVLQEQKIVIIRGFGYFSVEWVNIKFMHDAETKNQEATTLCNSWRTHERNCVVFDSV